jgi:hypothetical protein
MENIFWTGYCNKERVVAITDIEKIVNSYGYIMDFKQFSDISMSIKIELKELNIDQLYNVLRKYMTLHDFGKLESSSDVDRVVFLDVTFVKGTGDLRIEIPAIPG